MKHQQFESLDEIADHTAAGFVQSAAGSAFRLFRDRQFRRLAGFEKLSQTEQDRIFNELVAAFISLVMLLLEAPDLRRAREFGDYFTKLRKRIPKAHKDFLRESGVEKKYLRDWEQLLNMRYEEYARDKHEVRAAAMQIESEGKRLELDDLAKIQALVPVQAVAIGCHHHICRGKTEAKDDLFKALLKSLSEFYMQLRLGLEGRKLTPLMRLRMALQRWGRRIFPGK